MPLAGPKGCDGPRHPSGRLEGVTPSTGDRFASTANSRDADASGCAVVSDQGGRAQRVAFVDFYFAPDDAVPVEPETRSKALSAADSAAAEALSRITIADLLADDPVSLAGIVVVPAQAAAKPARPSTRTRVPA